GKSWPFLNPGSVATRERRTPFAPASLPLLQPARHAAVRARARGETRVAVRVPVVTRGSRCRDRFRTSPSRTWTSAGGERVAVSVGSAYPWSQLLGRMAVRSISLVSCLIAFALATPAPGAPSTTVAETFDGTLDKATWRLGTLDTIESTEG